MGAGGGGTIFAPATAMGRAAVAVIRVSGPGAGPALAALAGRLPPPRRAVVAALADPRDGAPLDRALVLWFPGPGSYTGEDLAELQVHGGRAVVAGVLEALAALPGLRPAEPGEFTRRAFDAGRLDLTAVEGLADLIDAETRAQARQALRQLGGALARLVEGWRDRLLGALARIEAELDFSDEDLPPGIAEAAGTAMREVAAEMARALDDGGRGERLREGLAVAIIGPPNVGKSSILNRLAGREAAIVSETAGTTRDVVEVHLDLGGLPVTVADTAGLREAGDAIEAEGVRRARIAAGAADIVLVVFSCAAPPGPTVLAEVDARAMLVANKGDLGPPPALPPGLPAPLVVSARTGAGFDRLEQALAEAASSGLDGAMPAVVTRSRHRAALAEAVAALDRAGTAPAPELAAEDLRLALRALGRIAGRVDVEDVLDRLFAEFCIGK